MTRLRTLVLVAILGVAAVLAAPGVITAINEAPVLEAHTPVPPPEPPWYV